MKNFYLFLLSIFLLTTFDAQAKIWRVNVDGSGDFAQPQEAHTAASSGDTLHIEGSAVVYSNLTLTKQLTVIGKGHSLVANMGLQARAEQSKIGVVAFSTGSDGSKIYGLTITNYVDLGAVTNTLISNLTISRNHIQYIYFRNGGPLSNIEISHNLFSHSVNGQIFSYQFAGTKTNILINNNLFLSGRVWLNTNISGTFENNVLASFSSHIFDSFVLRNNIAATTGGISFNNCIIENNLGAGTQFGSSNGNQDNVNMSTVFDTNPIVQDNDAMLKVGSPAIGAGVGGVDCGIFGGSNPYQISGIPAIPTIYSLTGTVSGSSLQITVSTRSNN